jgi:hypothetical protein
MRACRVLLLMLLLCSNLTLSFGCTHDLMQCPLGNLVVTSSSAQINVQSAKQNQHLQPHQTMLCKTHCPRQPLEIQTSSKHWWVLLARVLASAVAAACSTVQAELPTAYGMHAHRVAHAAGAKPRHMQTGLVLLKLTAIEYVSRAPERPLLNQDQNPNLDDGHIQPTVSDAPTS